MRKIVQILLLSLLISCQPKKDEQKRNQLMDHHTHLVSQATKQMTIEFLEKIEEPITNQDTLLSNADDLIQSMDKGGVEKAIVLSYGYFMDHFLESGDSLNLEKVIQENNWTASECNKYPDRLIPFLGINPVRDYSEKEIIRCYSDLNFKGIKLHFTNSGVDLRDPMHVRRVKRIFQLADSLMLPIVAHIKTSDQYDYQDASVFIQQILSEVKNTTVQIAHLGGWGLGYDSATLKANQAFIELIEQGKHPENLYFDLSAVVMADTSKSYTKGQYEMIARTVRAFGVDRIVFGSDYPIEGSETTKKLMMKHLPLDSIEIEQILRNRTPLE